MSADATPESLTPALSTDRVRDLYSWAFAWRTDDCDGETDLSRVREQNRAEFDRWLAAHDAEVARKALTDVADFISTPGVLWHGDDGVTVYADGAYGGNRMKLTDWLRARAEQIGEK